jgi:hypothetical protein
MLQFSSTFQTRNGERGTTDIGGRAPTLYRSARFCEVTHEQLSWLWLRIWYISPFQGSTLPAGLGTITIASWKPPLVRKRTLRLIGGRDEIETEIERGGRFMSFLLPFSPSATPRLSSIPSGLLDN